MIDLADSDECIAAAELVGRTGATELKIGWLDDTPPHRYYAHAQYRGARIHVEDQPTPDAALLGLVTRLLHGGRCTRCGKLIAMSDDPVPVGSRTLDGAAIDPKVEQARGLCRWTRVDRTWNSGCGPRAPETSSREKLARALADADAPTGMIAAAREGRWDDYLSEHPLPKVLLVEELRANGLDQLIDAVRAGDFDGTDAESEAWAASPEGQAAFAEFARPRLERAKPGAKPVSRVEAERALRRNRRRDR